MGLRGPPPKHPHLKVVAGTKRRDDPVPSVELPALSGAPDAPDWLPNAHSIKEWNRLAPILVANKMLAEADTGPLAHLCALHGKIVQLWAAGEGPTGHMQAQYNALASAFGIAPGWRGKVKPIGDKDAANKFAKFTKPTG